MSTPLFRMMQPVSDDRPNQFVGRRRHGNKLMNQYQLHCSRCGADGEVGISLHKFGEVIECPNKCGSLFLQTKTPGLFSQPRLIEVNPKGGEA